MKKIYKLKQWYSIEDAANRLSLTLGEEVSSAEVLELALDGHIRLFWFMRHVSVQEVEFQTCSIRVPLDKEYVFGRDLNDQNSVVAQFSDFFSIRRSRSCFHFERSAPLAAGALWRIGRLLPISLDEYRGRADFPRWPYC